MRQLLGLGLPRLANIEQKIEVFVRKLLVLGIKNEVIFYKMFILIR